MSRYLQVLAPLAFFPVLVFAEQNTAGNRNNEPVLAVVQTDASRPGDESLNCDGLEKELIASMNDPAVQSHFAKSGTKKQPKSLPQLSTFASRKANLIATRARTTLLATQNLQKEVTQMNELLTIAPQLVRGQRVMQLAQVRNCQWLQASAPERSTGHEAGH